MSAATKDDADVPEVPLALVSNSYLDEWCAQLRAKPIPWEVRVISCGGVWVARRLGGRPGGDSRAMRVGGERRRL
ncbi:hypothetical protein BC938DRAFT_475852 [Jimgerdemannia flammicorona]|uniref:Uncharacterized protein n=1 Tax=Jimgerdemannia flammicorona TaxID=994334 RepID=A0A433PN18_9FUNG|nr:hypothetical protein BC938DRAFT_475852 [Jimgerdemannia flammicorona]